MSLFRRRAKESTDPPADPAYPQLSRTDADWIRATGQQILRGFGQEVHTNEDGTVLIATSGHDFGLDNAMAKCLAAPRDNWREVLENHFGSVARGFSGPQVSDLTATQLAAQIRTRLMPADALVQGRADLSYARPFTEDLAVALCVDFPETVSYIDSQRAAELDLDALFTQGQQNTDDEPVDEVFTMDGTEVVVLQGESLFIATKVINMAALAQRVFGRAAPHGVVFAVPNRNIALLHLIESASAVTAIGQLTQLAAQQYDAGVGPVSPNSYHWHHGTVHKIGGPNPERSTIEITPTPGLTAVINQLAGQQS